MRKCLLAAAALWAAGCGQRESQPKAIDASKKDISKAVVEYFHVDPSTAGAVQGRIVFLGAKPPRKAISMAGDAGCEKAHAGKPVYDESLVAARDGALANAFVYIKSGLEDKKFEPPKEPVPLDQHGCQFVPRVFGMRAGQSLSVRNSDNVSHNIHPNPKNNREWNQQQSPKAPDVEHQFPRADIMIPVRCNVHSWMRAYIGVLDHPYFAVTAADGSFELKNIPPGDFSVAVWHEKLGEQTHQVHVGASQTAAANFTYR